MTKDEVTYEQPHGWMQQLVSETDGKKTIRYTFTKTRIGKNDIPIYFQDALKQPAQEPVAYIQASEINYIKAMKEEGIKEWRTCLGMKYEAGDVALYTKEQL